MKTNETEIINKLGLHARASAKLTQLAASFESEIWISKADKKVNSRLIITRMTFLRNLVLFSFIKVRLIFRIQYNSDNIFVFCYA